MRTYVGHSDTHAKYAVSELSWQVSGELAIVDAVVHERLPNMRGAWHETDIFVPRIGRWLHLHHDETSILEPPSPVPADGDRLADYVGRYRAASGTVDVITARGSTLYDRDSPTDQPEAMVHIGPGAFGFVDDPTVGVFIRDKGGAVTHCLWHLPSGQTTISRKLNP